MFFHFFTKKFAWLNKKQAKKRRRNHEMKKASLALMGILLFFADFANLAFYLIFTSPFHVPVFPSVPILFLSLPFSHASLSVPFLLPFPPLHLFRPLLACFHLCTFFTTPLRPLHPSLSSPSPPPFTIPLLPLLYLLYSLPSLHPSPSLPPSQGS